MGFLTYAAYSSVRHSYRQYSAAERAYQDKKYRDARAARSAPALPTAPHHPPADDVIAHLRQKMSTTFRKRKRAIYQAQIDHIQAGGAYTVFGYLSPAYLYPDTTVMTHGSPPPDPAIAARAEADRLRAKKRAEAELQRFRNDRDAVIEQLVRQSETTDSYVSLCIIHHDIAHIQAGGRYLVSRRFSDDGIHVHPIYPQSRSRSK